LEDTSGAGDLHEEAKELLAGDFAITGLVKRGEGLFESLFVEGLGLCGFLVQGLLEGNGDFVALILFEEV